MDGPNFGRTVTLTQESLTAMGERQAKQKALKEELDRQMLERRQLAEGRGGVDTTGMSKAQKKLHELQELRRQQQQAPPPSQVHQSQSLPANFSLGAMQQQQQPNSSMFPDVNQRSGGAYQMQPNFGTPGPGAYDTRSLPANIGSMMPPTSPMHSGAVNAYGNYAQPQNQLYPPAQNTYLSQQDPNGGHFNPQSNTQVWNGAQPGRAQIFPVQGMPTQGNTLTSPTFSQGGGGLGYANQQSMRLPIGVSSPPDPYTSSSPPQQQQQQQQAYSAPRQVFTLDDVMGFAKMATDAPQAQPTHSTGITYNNGYTSRDDPNPMVHSPPVSVAGDDAGYGRNGGGVPPRGVPPPPSLGAKGGPHAGHTKAKTPAVAGSGAARGAQSTPSNNSPGASGGVVGSRSRGQSPGAGTARAPSSGGGGVAKDRHILNKVERLQKELESREQQMQKMMEKNRNWEAQAQQLQSQLKEEKKRNKALVPTRAETAPQPAPTAPPKKLDPIVRPTNAAPGKTRPKPVAVGGPLSPNDGGGEASSGGGGNPLSHFPQTSPKSTVLAKNTFEATEQRPITAPDVLDPASHLLRSGHLPPIQRPSQPSSTLVKQPMPTGDGTSLSLRPKGPTVANGGGLLGAKAPPSLQHGHFHSSDKSPSPSSSSSASLGGGGAFSLNSTVSPRKRAAAAGARGGGGGGTLLAKDVREALKGTEFEAQMAMEEREGANGGGVRYMGDPSAVLEEEERVMKMMGSKASNFAFHSRRGDVEYATANNKRRSNNTNNRDPSNNDTSGNDEADRERRRGQGRQAPPKPPKYSRARYGGDATSDSEVGEGKEREEEDADECVDDDDDDYGTASASSVPFTIDHLQWFSAIQLITAQQCRRLWALLAGCDPDLVPVEHVIPEGYEDVASASGYSNDGEEEEEEQHEEDDGESGTDDDDYAYVSDAHGVVHKASPNGRHYDDDEGGDSNYNDSEEDRYTDDDDEFDAEAQRRALQHTRSPVPPSGSADSSRHHRRPSIQQGQRERAPSKPF